MNKCGRELVASNKPTVLAKPLLDAMMMENSQCDGCLADSASTNKSDRSQILGETDDLFDQLVTSETSPWRRWG